jgi:predicted NAD/FAD-binding protein
MNSLQSLPSQKHSHLFAMLNPLFSSSPTRTLDHYTYSHPVLSADSVRAQRLLARLNQQAVTAATGLDSDRLRAFVCAWMRYGFHEDGFASGLRAAAVLHGVTQPFPTKGADMEREVPAMALFVCRFCCFARREGSVCCGHGDRADETEEGGLEMCTNRDDGGSSSSNLFHCLPLRGA